MVVSGVSVTSRSPKLLCRRVNDLDFLGYDTAWKVYVWTRWQGLDRQACRLSLGTLERKGNLSLELGCLIV